MSEEINENEQSSGSEDLLGNIKEEFNRKIGNQESKIDQLMKQNEALIQAVMSQQNTSQPQASQSSEDDNLSDLFYSDPNKAIDIITQRTEKRVEERLMSQLNQKERQSQVINELAMEYPELSDQNSDLAQEAVKIYSSLSADDQRNPISYKLAVQQAALNQGVRPRSKRSDSDSFTMRGRGGDPPKRKEGVSDATLAIADLMGLNINDPKVKESLAKNSKRDYKRYQ